MKRFYTFAATLILFTISIFIVKHYQYPPHKLQMLVKVVSKQPAKLYMYYGSELEEYKADIAIVKNILPCHNSQLIIFDFPLNIDASKVKLSLENQKDTVFFEALYFQTVGQNNALLKQISQFHDFKPFHGSTKKMSLKNGAYVFSPNEMTEIENTHIGELLDEIYYTKTFKYIRVSSIVFFIASVALVFYVLFCMCFAIHPQKSNTKIVYFIIFSLLFATPTVFNICSSNESISNVENRNKTAFPVFELKHFSVFFTDILAYVNDNFGGREKLIEWHTFLNQHVFKAKSFGNYTIMGDDDWMFFYSKQNKSFYINSDPLTEIELKNIAINQLEIQAWLKLQQVDYFLFLAPATASIYPEHLPEWYKKCHQFTKREQIIDYLKRHTNIKVIYADDYIKSKKQLHQLYYKSDTHWNYFGGYYGYEYLIQYLRNIYPTIPAVKNELSDNEFVPIKFSEGNLLKMAGLLGKFSEPDTMLYPKSFGYQFRAQYDSVFRNVNFKNKVDFNINVVLDTRNNSLPNAPKLFVQRDSYANYYLKFLSNHFNAVRYNWDTEIKSNDKPEFGTNIFIHEVAEYLIAEMKPTPEEIKTELKKNGITVKLY